MNRFQANVLFPIAALTLAGSISYGLAWLNEPRALWLWRDLLGVI